VAITPRRIIERRDGYRNVPDRMLERIVEEGIAPCRAGSRDGSPRTLASRARCEPAPPGSVSMHWRTVLEAVARRGKDADCLPRRPRAEHARALRALLSARRRAPAAGQRWRRARRRQTRPSPARPRRGVPAGTHPRARARARHEARTGRRAPRRAP